MPVKLLPLHQLSQTELFCFQIIWMSKTVRWTVCTIAALCYRLFQSAFTKYSYTTANSIRTEMVYINICTLNRFHCCCCCHVVVARVLTVLHLSFTFGHLICFLVVWKWCAHSLSLSFDVVTVCYCCCWCCWRCCKMCFAFENIVSNMIRFRIIATNNYTICSSYDEYSLTLTPFRSFSY